MKSQIHCFREKQTISLTLVLVLEGLKSEDFVNFSFRDR